MQTYKVERLQAENLLRRYVRWEKTRRNVDTLSAESFYPVRPKAVAKLLGWGVEVTDGVEGFEGQGVHVLGKVDSGEGQKLIRVNGNAADGERNFTIAHEIAHLVLHRSQHGCNYRFRSARKLLSQEEKRREAAADAFASALLMPEKAVRSQFKKQTGTDEMFHRSARLARLGLNVGREDGIRHVAEQLAAYKKDGRPALSTFFGVSRSAMAIRLLELGLIY